MKKVRQGVFETNSSSTHSICIAKDVELEIPASLHFSFGEFGWECDTLQSTNEKASYLYTGLTANGMNDKIKEMVATLEGKGVVVTLEEPIYKTHKYNDKDGNPQEYTSGENVGYVDHADEMGDFIEAVLEDEGKLMRYLFSPLSFIITGNDNDDEDVDIEVEYAHDEYYKGN